MWIWLADHDLDGSDQISLYSGHGLMSESQGPVWMIGTGMSLVCASCITLTHFFLAVEHHVSYQYFLKGAANHYIGLAQTETVRVFPSLPQASR